MNEQPKRQIEGHIENRNGIPVFVVTSDNRPQANISIPKVQEKINVDIKKYRPKSLSYKD